MALFDRFRAPAPESTEAAALAKLKARLAESEKQPLVRLPADDFSGDARVVAEGLNRAGVESRAGCHCATLAHHALELTPRGSCRLSFYLYNTLDEVDQAVAAVAAIAAGPSGPAERGFPWTG